MKYTSIACVLLVQSMIHEFNYENWNEPSLYVVQCTCTLENGECAHILALKVKKVNKS